jgi:hypothetical protein
LDKQEHAADYWRSKVQAHIDQIFGDQRTRNSHISVRTKGKVRAAMKIGLMNLTCEI